MTATASSYMLALLINACSPEGECKEHRLMVFEPNMTPFQCVMNAQPEVARWVQSHPNVTITKIRCSRVVDLLEES